MHLRLSIACVAVLLWHSDLFGEQPSRGELAASYFEAFFAQTADWGNMDVSLEASIFEEDFSSGAIVERHAQERFLRTDAHKVFVESARRSVLNDATDQSSSHRLVVSLQDGPLGWQRSYPARVDQYKLQETGSTFEWLANPIGFRTLGVLQFPFRSGLVDEQRIEPMRRQLTVPDERYVLTIRSKEATVSAKLAEGDKSSNWSYVFDLDSLLLKKRRWNVRGSSNYIKGSETIDWEMRLGRYRPVRIVGFSEQKRAIDGRDETTRMEYEADYVWRKPEPLPDGELMILLKDKSAAIRFLEIQAANTSPDPTK